MFWVHNDFPDLLLVERTIRTNYSIIYVAVKSFKKKEFQLLSSVHIKLLSIHISGVFKKLFCLFDQK